MCALFRMQLNLPMEEKLETHLYENVTLETSEDCNSDRSPSPLEVLANKVTSRKDNFVYTPEERPSSRKSPVVAGPPVPSNKNRVTQIEQQSSSDSYVNVSYDLIDFTDDGNSQKPQSNVTRTGTGQVAALLKDFSFDKMDTVDDGSDVKPKLFIGSAAAAKQSSSQDYAVPVIRSQGPAEMSETSDYVISARGWWT